MEEKTEKTEQVHDWDGCLVCAVRALTMGTPKNWGLGKDNLEVGASVTGVVMRRGEQPSHFESRVPYVDLWLGGVERVRVAGHGTSLRTALECAEAEVGDTLTVRYEGEVEILSGRMKGSLLRKFSAEVRRGHH